MRYAALASPRRWVGKIIGRYNPERRPRLAAWTWAIILAVIVGFGVLGYLIPATLSRLF